MAPGPVHVDAFVSFTLAILLLFAGRELTRRIAPLRRYSIPEPVVGGFLCAAVVGVLDLAAGVRVQFELGARDMLLLYFFAGIGLKSDVRTLLRGGRPLLVLLVLACVFIALQNGVGMAVAAAFGFDARAGLMLGSISLVGGFGTTLAWASDFVSRLGIGNALELGTAGSTFGLIAACVIGGPVASYLMRRHALQPSPLREQDIGVPHDAPDPPLDYYGVLRAWLWLNVTLLIGQGLTAGLRQLGLNLPDFVGCLLTGIVLRNGLPLLWPRALARQWQGTRQGLALISDICLGMFLTMALMGLQLWAFEGMFGLVAATMALQVLLAVAFTVFVVFRFMGRDYEAAVVCAGFGGIALGSTSTAVANMSAVTRQHGAAHRAFVIVPLVCGFFVDVVNAMVIGALVR